MSALSAVASVGAGGGQVRPPGTAAAARMKDQGAPPNDVRIAALRLITEALAPEGTTARDLDVLA